MINIQRLRWLIESKGFTASEIARHIGASPSTLTRMLKGERPRSMAKWAKAIAEFLGVPEEEILAPMPAALQPVPIVAILDDNSWLFDYSIIQGAAKNQLALAPPCPGCSNEDQYAIWLPKGFAMIYAPGMVLYVRRNPDIELRNGDLVVYVDADNRAHIRRLQESDDHLVLINPLDPHENVIVLPMRATPMLDLVIGAWRPSEEEVKLIFGE